MSLEYNNHLLVISIDALNSHDFDYIKRLPTLGSFIKDGSYIRNLISIYPSLTYPCHTSITTGTYPNKHGIISNKKCQPKRYLNEEWYWYEKYIKVPTIFDYAMKKGYSCGAVLWPVMAGAKITYNVPEIWPVKLENFIKTFINNSTTNLLPQILKYGIHFTPPLQPSLDNFTGDLTNYLITNKKPNLLFVHFTELDYIRHKLGLYAKEGNEVLTRMDKRVARIIDSTKKAGIYNETSFIILGDHGTNDYDYYICINSIFHKANLINTDKNNKITSWKAFCNSCGGSAQIFLRNKQDKSTLNKVYNILNDIYMDSNSCIKNIYTANEANKKFCLDGNFSFVVEAKDEYVFGNYICDELVVLGTKFPKHVADHGYEPCHRNMRTMLLAKGMNINNSYLSKAYLVDIAPTMAKLLGISMQDVDGKCLNKIINVN
jgi:predicted AlkP superfamily pyrophosphatase or phosphodiesterase